MAAGNIPYIGSKISLITTSDIRYEGILYTLNREESTIAVQNVRSFGTEGRRCPEVPMSNEIYDFIIFRGKDLKDLTVIQSAPERPSPSAFGAGADFSDSHGGSLYSQTHTDPYGGGLQAGGGAAQASSLSSAYGRQSAVPRNGFAAAVPAAAGKGPMASSYGGASYPSPASAASSRAVELKSAPAAAYGAVTASRAPYPSVADPHSAAMVGAVPRSAPGLKTFADEAAANAVNVGVGAGGMPVQRGTAQEATAEARSSSESKGRQAAAGAAAEQKARLASCADGASPDTEAKQEAAAAVAAAAAAGTRGRGKGGGAQKKSLYEVLRFHPRAQEAIMKTMRSQRTSVVQPSELRAMSETNGSVYHFYVDFLNYCCPPSHTVQSDEQQWESLSKALKKNFEKEFGSGQNQKAEQPQRPNNTLGDFISVETSKAGKKGVKVPARGGGRLGRGTGRGDKKDEVSSGKLDASGSLEDVGTQSSSWVCPRCTLRNENTLLECAACGTSKQQAALWAEFPPLG